MLVSVNYTRGHISWWISNLITDFDSSTILEFFFYNLKGNVDSYFDLAVLWSKLLDPNHYPIACSKTLDIMSNTGYSAKSFIP